MLDELILLYTCYQSSSFFSTESVDSLTIMAHKQIANEYLSVLIKAKLFIALRYVSQWFILY